MWPQLWRACVQAGKNLGVAYFAVNGGAGPTKQLETSSDSGAGMVYNLVPVVVPHPWVDTSRFPIVVVTFAPSATVYEMRALTVALRRFATGLNEPIGLISDLSEVRTQDPDARQVYAEFVREMRGVSGKWVRGTAVVTQNPFQRAVFNLHATLVGKTPYPVHAFSAFHQALPWLLAKMGGPH